MAAICVHGYGYEWYVIVHRTIVHVFEFSYAKHISNEKLRIAKMFTAITRDV